MSMQAIVNGKEENATSEQYKHYIDKSQLFAKYQDSKREMIGVIIVKLKDNKTKKDKPEDDFEKFIHKRNNRK